MKKPLITVIIPTYNRSQYIKQAIDSALNQTHKNIELIIIDDGSKDNTSEVLKKYDTYSNINNIALNHNAGVANARNLGLKEAKGDYIAFLDSDDFWEKNKIELQLNEFDKDSNIGLVHTGVIEFGKGWEREKIWEKENRLEGWCREEIFTKWYIFHSSIMIKKQHIEKIGNFDSTFPYSEDYEWWLRVAEYCKFKYIPTALVWKRYTENQMSSNLTKQYIYQDKARIKFIKSLKNESEKEKYERLRLQTFQNQTENFYWKRDLKGLREMCRYGIQALGNKVFKKYLLKSYIPRIVYAVKDVIG